MGVNVKIRLSDAKAIAKVIAGCLCTFKLGHIERGLILLYDNVFGATLLASLEDSLYVLKTLAEGTVFKSAFITVAAALGISVGIDEGVYGSAGKVFANEILKMDNGNSAAELVDLFNRVDARIVYPAGIKLRLEILFRNGLVDFIKNKFITNLIEFKINKFSKTK